jgi:hypothetical protein
MSKKIKSHNSLEKYELQIAENMHQGNIIVENPISYCCIVSCPIFIKQLYQKSSHKSLKIEISFEIVNCFLFPNVNEIENIIIPQSLIPGYTV